MTRVRAPLALTILASTLACGGPDCPNGAERCRRYVAATWDTVFVVGGSAQDTLLFRPRLLAARGPRLYAYDYSDAQIKAFDSSGALQWRFGREGSGPGEFTNAMDLVVASDGSVWVLDSGTDRLSIISSEGTLLRMVSLGPPRTARLIPEDSGTFLALAFGSSEFWTVRDDSGLVQDRYVFPAPEWAAANPSFRQVITGTSESGDTWAVAFLFGDLFAVYDERQLRCTGRLIEGTPLPAPDVPRERGSRPPIWAVAIAVSDSAVYVLANDETRPEGRVLDEYRASDCAYRHSLPLPWRFSTMALGDNVFFFEHEDPAPTIVALRGLVVGVTP